MLGGGRLVNRISEDGSVTAPLAMRSTVAHLHVLHQRVVIVAVETTELPNVADSDVAQLHPLPTVTRPDVIVVRMRFGYLQRTDVPDALAELSSREDLGLDLASASWFLSTIDLLRAGGDDDADGHGAPQAHLPWWRRSVFTATSRLTTDAARAFDLPPARTVVMGSRIEV